MLPAQGRQRQFPGGAGKTGRVETGFLLSVNLSLCDRMTGLVCPATATFGKGGKLNTPRGAGKSQFEHFQIMRVLFNRHLSLC